MEYAMNKKLLNETIAKYQDLWGFGFEIFERQEGYKKIIDEYTQFSQITEINQENAAQIIDYLSRLPSQFGIMKNYVVDVLLHSDARIKLHRPIYNCFRYLAFNKHDNPLVQLKENTHQNWQIDGYRTIPWNNAYNRQAFGGVGINDSSADILIRAFADQDNAYAGSIALNWRSARNIILEERRNLVEHQEKFDYIEIEDWLNDDLLGQTVLYVDLPWGTPPAYKHFAAC